MADTRTSPQAQLYTFPNAAAYLAARDGANRLGYTSFTQYFGLPDLEYNTSQYGLFVQDDWRVSSDLKVLYGVRYDLYDAPDGMPNAPIATSREFPTSSNNFAPRVGAVWTLGESRRTVLRANTGLMYDQTLNAIYEQALQNDGTNARASATFTPTQAGAPAFPAVLSTGAGAHAEHSRATVDPDFKVARSWQNNVQFERALRRSLLGGGRRARTCKGYNLPVVTNINLINPTGTLADGRPIFSTAVNATTRVDPRYNVINSVQSLGESTYKNMTLQLTRRQCNGIGFDLAYTLGKSEDNAPITGTLSVQGDAGRSDPTNLDRDLGPNILDQRHTFVGSIVATPQFERGGAAGAILNDNVFGLAHAVRERHPGEPAQQPRAEQRRHRERPSDRRAAQLAEPAGAQERRLPLLAPVPHPGPTWRRK